MEQRNVAVSGDEDCLSDVPVAGAVTADLDRRRLANHVAVRHDETALAVHDEARARHSRLQLPLPRKDMVRRRHRGENLDDRTQDVRRDVVCIRCLAARGTGGGVGGAQRPLSVQVLEQRVMLLLQGRHVARQHLERVTQLRELSRRRVHRAGDDGSGVAVAVVVVREATSAAAAGRGRGHA